MKLSDGEQHAGAILKLVDIFLDGIAKATKDLYEQNDRKDDEYDL